MAFTFLKTGAASAKLAQKAAAEAEARQQQGNRMFRFWMKEKEEARITFVDGDLAKDGPLAGYPDPPRYYEHNLFLNGVWNNFFVCPERTSPDSGEKCPLCESGDKPSLIALFTIIDHRQIHVQQGQDEGVQGHQEAAGGQAADLRVADQARHQAGRAGGLHV